MNMIACEGLIQSFWAVVPAAFREIFGQDPQNFLWKFCDVDEDVQARKKYNRVFSGQMVKI